MNKYFYTLVCVLIISILPTVASAQVVAKQPPRKYDKVLTAVESFARLNAQIAIRQQEYKILVPFIGDVVTYANQLAPVCDAKCTKSVNSANLKLTKFNNNLFQAELHYEAMTPNITEQNAALMAEIQRVEFLPVVLSKDKAMAALNQLNLENIYHYKAYNTTYHSADSAMLSLAASSDLTTIVNSFASTTDRLSKTGRISASMSATIQNLKNRVPDIRARLKVLEDKRKSLVCTATLQSDYGVSVHCTP